MTTELTRLLDPSDAEKLASLIYDGTASEKPAWEQVATVATGPAPLQQGWQVHCQPPPWAYCEPPDARLPVAELRQRLQLLGVDTARMLERSELEAAHTREMLSRNAVGSVAQQPDRALHRQLIRLGAWLLPDPAERAARSSLAARVEQLVRQTISVWFSCRAIIRRYLSLCGWPVDLTRPRWRWGVCISQGCRSVRYGSESLGLAAYSSDIDVAVLAPPRLTETRKQRDAVLHALTEAVRRAPWADGVECRGGAKVPLVRFVEVGTGASAPPAPSHLPRPHIVVGGGGHTERSVLCGVCGPYRYCTAHSDRCCGWGVAAGIEVDLTMAPDHASSNTTPLVQQV
jgi:hypothetical protein